MNWSYGNPQLYCGAKYYNPRLWRFLSVDPLADKYHNLSPYTYVANNPVKYIDPDGKRIVLPNIRQANKLAGDLNKIYSNKYGVNNAFKVITKEVSVTKSNPDYSWWNPNCDCSKTIEVNETRTFIEANEEFSWDTDKYTSQMKDIIDADT